MYLNYVDVYLFIIWCDDDDDGPSAPHAKAKSSVCSAAVARKSIREEEG